MAPESRAPYPCRIPHCVKRPHVMSVGRGRNETFQQVNSVMVAIRKNSINYIFLVVKT